MKHIGGSLVNPYVFFDLKLGDTKAGRVVIELFRNKVPKSAENFRALCTGERGFGIHGKPLHYKGIQFHKVVPMCMVQGGDIINNDGTSGESIYGDAFEDECLTLTHEKEGMVGMCNMGPDSNQSQFYITTQPCSHLDTTNVIVGRVVKGFNVIVEMSSIPRENDKPLEPIAIVDCGEFKPGEPWNIEENDGTDDKYPPWPDDWNVDEAKSNVIEKAITAIKNSGNYYFNNNNFIDSERKYVKCLRYIDWYFCHKKTKNRLLEELRVVAIMNLAASKLKRHKFKEVIGLCSDLIDHDSNNGKAYYRRARARLALKDYDKALDDLNTALKLYPNDGSIRAVLNQTKKYKLSYLKKERNFFSKMLA